MVDAAGDVADLDVDHTSGRSGKNNVKSILGGAVAPSWIGVEHARDDSPPCVTARDLGGKLRQELAAPTLLAAVL